MEYFRTSGVNTGKVVFLMGNILSNSLVLFYINEQLPIEEFVRFVLMSCLLCIMTYGVVKSLYQKSCQKCLIICQMVGLPLCVILLNKMKFHSAICYLTITQYGIFNTLMLLYLIFFPKTINFETDWSFRKLNNIHGILKLIKVNLFILIFQLFSTDFSLSMAGLIILFETIHSLARLNYESFDHQVVSTLSSILSVVSFAWYCLHYFDCITYSILPQCLITILYLQPNLYQIIVRILQNKYSYEIRNHYFTSKMCIPILKLIEEVIKQKKTILFSIKFQNLVKQHYSKWLNRQKIKSIVLNQKIIKLEKVQNIEKLTNYQLFMAFTNLVLFPKNTDSSLQINKIEFFTNLNTRKQICFINKTLVLVCSLKFKNSNENYFKNIRTHMLYNNLLNSLSYEQNKKEQLVKFQNKFAELRSIFAKLCQEKATNVQKNCIQKTDIAKHIESYISLSPKKEKLKKMFQQCMESQNYFLYHDFLYVYLLFSVIFSKRVCETKKQVRQYFLAPQINLQETRQMKTKDVLLCSCGFGDFPKGSIINASSSFRKKYQVNYKQFGKVNIAKFIPERCQRQHNALFDKCLSFDFPVQKPHKQYDCYIELKVLGDKFLKKVNISTRLYYDIQYDLGYFCELDDNGQNEENNVIFVEQAKIKKIRRNQESYNFGEKPIVISQLKKQFHLKKVFIEAQSNHQIRSENWSINTNLSKKFYNNMDNSTEDKFIKMEQIIHKTQFTEGNFAYLLILLIISGCFYLLFSLNLNIKVNSSLESSKSSINIQKRYFSTLISSEEQMAYMFVLLRQNQIGFSNDTIYKSSGIPSVAEAIKNRIVSQLMNAFDPIQQSFFQDNIFQMPTLAVYNNRIYQYFYLQDAERLISPRKAQTFLKSLSFEYLKTDLKTLKQQNLQKFIKSIHDLIMSGDMDKQNGFLQNKYNKILSILKMQNQNIESVKKLGLIIGILWTAFYVIIYIKSLKFRTQYLLLMQSISKVKYIKKLAELNLIKNQLELIENNEIKNVQITLANQLVYQTRQISLLMSFQQFQNLPQSFKQLKQQKLLKKTKKILEFENDKKEDSLSFQEVTTKQFYKKIISANKNSIIFVFVIILGIYFVQYERYQFATIDLQRMKNYSQIVWKAGKIKKSLQNLLLVVWNSYIQEKFLTDEESAHIFQKSVDNLKQQAIRRLIKENFQPQTAKKALYENICNFNPSIKLQCFIFSNIPEFSFISLIPEFYKQMIIIRNNQLNHVNFNFQQYVSSASLQYFILGSPLIQSIIGQGFEDLSRRVNTHIQMSNLFFMIGYIMFLLYVLGNSYYSYQNLKIIRQEILSFDTPYDLYSISSFKPYLNKLLRAE